MYLGICINNDDPEKRGRVQVFIPHIMPTLYENWNEAGADIKLNCVGDNLPEGLTADIVDKLKKLLPWAEAASPVFGTSAPGNLYGGGAAAASTGSAGNFYDQSPVPDPVGAGMPSRAGIITGGGTPSGAVATIAPKDRVSSGAHLDVRWTPGTKPGTSVPPLDLVGRYIQVGGIPADQLRVTDGPTGPGGKNFGSGRSLERHPAWDLAFKTPGAIAGAPVSLTNGATVTFGKDSSSMGSAYADVMTPEGSLRLYHLTTGSVQVGAGSSASGSGGPERASVSADSPSAPGQANCTPPTFQEGAPDSQYGNVANQNITQAQNINLNTTPSQAASLGNASPAFQDQYNRVFSSLNGSKFIGTVPNDGAKYGITTGSQSEWANLFTRLASVESGFRPDRSADINGGKSGKLTSFGLYQMGQAQFNTFGGGNIYSANDNTNAFVRYAESMYFGTGAYGRGGGNNVLSGKSGNQWLGIAAGYGPLRRTLTGSQNQNESQLLSGNISSAQAQGGAVAPSAAEAGLGQQSVCMVNNTDPHGPAVSQNLNSVAKGLFSYPAAGAMLWCFFREGNPLFPVYFAVSYSQAEWQSAYRTSSPGPGYNPSPQDGQPQETGGMLNLNGVGGLAWLDRNNLQDRTQDQKSIMLFGEDGSNLFMGRGYSQFLSKFDHRNQTEGDRWETTLGFKEQWVQGDYNRVVMGDYFQKIGNVSQTAANAVDEIGGYIKQIQAPFSETSGGGSVGGAGSLTGPAAGLTGGAESSSTQSAADGKLTGTASENLKALQEGAAKTGGFYNTAVGKFQQTGFANSAPRSTLVTNASLAQVERNAPAARRNQYVNVRRTVPSALPNINVK